MSDGETTSPGQRSAIARRGADLEPVILGLVWKFGPVSAYAVRKHFSDSPASDFSASTGSVYPALRRLEARGRVRSRSVPRGDQRRRLYEATAAGEEELASWLESPPRAVELSVPYDPFRVRLYFLERLSPARRRRFLRTAISELEAQLVGLRRYVEEHAQDPRQRMSLLASSGCLHVTRAQIRWLRWVERELFGDPR